MFFKKFEILRQKYLDAGIEKELNYIKYNDYLFSYHSTAIEGSTLTYNEVQTLLDNNIAIGGKPFIHQQMNQDHYRALQNIKQLAKEKTTIDVDVLKTINANVMQSTGSVVKCMLGEFDSSRGDLRLVNVRAGGASFMDYKKVPGKLEEFCNLYNQKINNIKSWKERYTLATWAHFNLVNIHPWSDGNGRTARLLMQYTQLHGREPMIMMFNEDKPAYYDALDKTREKEDINPLLEFLIKQQEKHFETELNKSKNNKDNGLLM